MFSSQNYLTNHSLQKRDVYTILQNYKEKMKWIEKQKVIDIGCGTGDVTHDYLLPLIPSIGELVGIDISKSMVDFAATQYTNSYSSFEVMNITKSEVVDKYASYFDSAFSFFCLHWVQDQRKAMKNIYSILKPGGEILFILVVNFVNYFLFEALGESPKWAPYMQDYKDLISPYRNSADPVCDVKNLMQSSGFQVDDCVSELNSYTFQSKQLFFDWTKGVNPLLKNIPAHLLQEFDQAWEKTIFSDNSCILNEKTNQVTISYSTITVFARKKYRSRGSRGSLPIIIYDQQKLAEAGETNDISKW